MSNQMLQKAMRPVWSGGEIFKETFMMKEENDECEAGFLFQPKQILKVESYDGKTEYEEGKDFMIVGNKLCLTKNSRIPHTTWDCYFYATEAEAKKELEQRTEPLGFGPVATTDGRYLSLKAIANPEYMTNWMVAVSYTTEEAWNGDTPVSQLEKLPRFYQKMLAKESCKIVLYGDSISCGYDCSGVYNLEPMQPMWPELLKASLQEYYDCDIQLENISLGGADSKWAIEHLAERMTTQNPTLVILGYGMNDRCDGEEYKKLTEKLISTVRQLSPESEIVLIATTLPNELTNTPPFYFSSYQQEHAAALHSIQGTGIAVADVQSVQKEMMKRKRYIDLTGNWLNHPNDFLARIQAQVLDVVLKP